MLEVAEDIDAAAAKALRDEAKDHKVQIVARLGSDVRVERGSQVEVTFRPDRMYFFDTVRAARFVEGMPNAGTPRAGFMESQVYPNESTLEGEDEAANNLISELQRRAKDAGLSAASVA